MKARQFVIVVSVVSVLSGASAFAQTPAAPRPANPMPQEPRTQPAPVTPRDTMRPATPSVSLDVTEVAKSSRQTPAEDAVTFIQNTGRSGTFEVALAKLAQTKAARADVKAFAMMLETDHTKANEALMAIAKAKNVSIPTELTQEQKDLKAKLDTLTGAAFDSAYVDAMAAAHTKGVASFTAAAKNSDADVRAFAEKTLPTLKHHLAEAQKLAKM